jgi:hypothetical protein
MASHDLTTSAWTRLYQPSGEAEEYVTIQNRGPNPIALAHDNALASANDTVWVDAGVTVELGPHIREAIYGRATTANQAGTADTRVLVTRGV